MKKKLITALILTASAILLVCASVLGTMAFLMSSFVVTNTFTIGEVGIEMYESRTNQDGEYIDAGGNVIDHPYEVNDKKTADANTYRLVPGKTYIKDPTIYVKAGSVPSFLFVKIKNDITDIECACNTAGHEDHLTIAAQLQNEGWQIVKENPENKEKLYLYVGKTDENTTNATSAIPSSYAEATAIVPKLVGGSTPEEYDVFNNFTIDVNTEDEIPNYGPAKVILTAFAIQASEFEEANADFAGYQIAWNAIIDKSSYVGTKFPAANNN